MGGICRCNVVILKNKRLQQSHLKIRYIRLSLISIDTSTSQYRNIWITWGLHTNLTHRHYLAYESTMPPALFPHSYPTMFSTEQNVVRRPLNNSHVAFPYFLKLRCMIWDLVSPDIIDVYCHRDGFEYVRPQPFRHAWLESRQFHFRVTTYLEGSEGFRNVLFHFDQDYFGLNSRDKLEQLRKIILPPASLTLTGYILRCNTVEIQACLVHIPDHLIVSPSSAFCRNCLLFPCQR